MKGPKRFTPVLYTLGALMGLAVVGYLAIRGLHQEPQSPVWYVPGGNPVEGQRLIQKYGCGACHTIPGIREATGKTCPDLAGIRQRIYLGGQLPNTPDNLVNWIVDPQEFAPGTAMPDLGVTRDEARDIAAYLYSMD